MYSIVVVVREWTDPVTGQSYKPGKVAAVEGDRLMREDTYGTAGVFRHPAPWERVTVGGTAPLTQPPNPADAQPVAPENTQAPARMKAPPPVTES